MKDRPSVEQITEYQDQRPRVLRAEGLRLEVFVGDQRPALGEALRVEGPDGESTLARVIEHQGSGRSEALVLGAPAWLKAGCAVQATGAQAQWPTPGEAVWCVGETSWVTEGGLPVVAEPPALAQLDPARPELILEVDAIDMLSPIPSRGVTLVVDASPSRAAFDALVGRAHERLAPDASLGATPAGAPPLSACALGVEAPREDALLGLRAALAWARTLRDAHPHTLVALELPPVALPSVLSASPERLGLTLGEVVTLLGDALGSTREGAVTTLLRLPIAQGMGGLAVLAETLKLGDVDAQLMIDTQGRLDPLQCRSRAQAASDARQLQRDELRAALALIASMEDHIAIFGLDDVDDELSDLLGVLDVLELDVVEAIGHAQP